LELTYFESAFEPNFTERFAQEINWGQIEAAATTHFSALLTHQTVICAF